jgi:type IV secretion system protein TrbG
MKLNPLLFLAFISVSAFGQTPTPPASSTFDSSLLGGSNPTLTEEERAGVNITQAWRDKSYSTMVGQAGTNSSVRFRFGESLPSIVCAILQVTDIELQPGEQITHINLGDSARWSVESARSGSGEDQIEHIIVKPRDIGLSTSLVVTTDHRTYHLLLVSTASDFMHAVTFLYEDAKPAAPVIVDSAVPSPAPTISPPVSRRHRSAADGKQIGTASHEVSDGADESYTVQGKAEWAPEEVYSKDGKTYLEMPSSMRHKEAPVLFEEKRAGWFRHSKALVNYRVHGRWYVVDRVLDNATLVSGVGAGQSKVIVQHVNKPKRKETEVVRGQ